MNVTSHSPSDNIEVIWGAREQHLTQTDPLLKIDRAAALLGLSPATLTKWRTKRPGYGPRAFKMDQILRYRVSDLQGWLDQRCDDHIALTVPQTVPQVMNLKQASEYLSISSASISTWRTRRPGYAPPGFKAGDGLRFRLADLNRWIQDHLETHDGSE